MNKRKQILARAYFIAALIFLFAVAVIVRLIQIQTTNVDKYKTIAETTNFRNIDIPAVRGNMYASDGVLLATTVTCYDIRMDLKTIKEPLYSKNINALADSLGKMFDKPKHHYSKKLDSARKANVQYLRIANGIDYDQFTRMKKFPILSKGQNKGGFIVERRNERIKTITGFGTRTLGFDYGENKRAGLEGAFSKYLRGIDGKEIQQRINQKDWKPIKVEIEPEEGKDVYTTIDMRIQDIAYSALQDQLEDYSADHGSVVIMEVKTGKIVAMANLKRKSNGTYDDLQNFAVWETSEPGSTFKSVSMLALLDDNYVTPNTKVDIENGRWEIFRNKIIRDDHGSGMLTMSEVMSHSSNIGIAKMVYKFYKNNPEDFIKKLSSWNLTNKTGIDIPGESSPYIPSPSKPEWNNMSLPWMTFGYGLELTPLQILTFYNGIANNGKLMKPQLLDKIEKNGKVLESFRPIIMNSKMAPPEKIEELKKMLTFAVEEGTSRSIFTTNLPMAGKTGTTQIEYWNNRKGLHYQASFCGFFPADNPEYSCIVVINKPHTETGYYGAKIAAPVFKEIAGKISLKKPLDIHIEKGTKKDIIKQITKEHKKIKTDTKIIPNVVGIYGMEAVPALENMGLKVVYEGSGKVYKQSITGETIRPGLTVYLKLQ